QRLVDEVAGVGAPELGLDERILLLESLGDRTQRLVLNHRRIDNDLAFLPGALDQDLLAVRALEIGDLGDGCSERGSYCKRRQRDSKQCRDNRSHRVNPYQAAPASVRAAVFTGSTPQ